MGTKLTRRDFLKGCAVAVGGMAAATLAAEVATPLVFPEEMVFDDNTSLWALDQPAKNAPLTEDLEVDVAVIGGGYTGLSAAYHLLQRYPERTVALFEAKGVGHGASGRNGGMILPQPSNEYMQVYSNPQTHRLTYEATVNNLNQLASLIEAQGIDCELERNGVLLVIVKESQVEGYLRYSEEARSLGIPVEFWDRRRTSEEIGSDVYFASLFDPNGAEVHPMRLIRSLKKAAEGAGAHIYENSPVLEIEDGEVLRLIVGEVRHIVRARAVVLGTNGYTSKLGFFKNSVLAIHTPMALTPALPESTFAEIGWNRRLPYSDTYNILYHLSRTSDNRILIGSGHVDYFFNNGVVYGGNLEEMRIMLMRELERIYPQLSGMDFEYIWTGVLGFSIDFSQSVGVMGEHRNIYYGLAYAGHGINLATLFGRIIADLYAGEQGQWRDMPFLNHRFIPLPPEPLKWVGVQANIAYLRYLDSLD
jgi:glycine/D-amino acid oxidase-like deaminating enzyme